VTPIIQTVAELQIHVKYVLCEKDHIDPTQADLRQALLKRGTATCGVLFQLRGPRLLRTYAIWSATEQRVLFYESTGIRFAELKLENGPKLTDIVDDATTELKNAS